MTCWVQNRCNFRDSFIHYKEIRHFSFLPVLNSDTLIFLQGLLPLKRYIKKHFIFYQSDTTVQGFFVTKTLLLHVQNVVEWVLAKITHLCLWMRRHKDVLLQYLNTVLYICTTVIVKQWRDICTMYIDICCNRL